MVHLLNVHYPVAFDHDPIIRMSRLAICAVIAVEIFLFLLLRLGTMIGVCRLHSGDAAEEETKGLEI